MENETKRRAASGVISADSTPRQVYILNKAHNRLREVLEYLAPYKNCGKWSDYPGRRKMIESIIGPIAPSAVQNWRAGTHNPSRQSLDLLIAWYEAHVAEGADLLEWLRAYRAELQGRRKAAAVEFGAAGRGRSRFRGRFTSPALPAAGRPAEAGGGAAEPSKGEQ
jgi:hypothetical protein